jgi:enoyl-CoA hydratase/carnithine racemase
MAQLTNGELSKESIPEAAVSTARAEALVGRELDGQVAVLTLQSAPHNLLTNELLDEVISALDWVKQVGARAVVLRSRLRHFSAGADMAAFESVERGEAPQLPLLELLEAFEALPVPIIASVHGICVGGGLELALACDFVVAGETAKLGAVEVGLGLVPLMGAVQRMTQRAGAARAKEMALFGRRYDAHTLERWNIINRVVRDDELAVVTMTLAQELAHGPSVAHASIKRLVAIAQSEGVSAADHQMQQLQAEVWRSQDLKTGIASLIEKGPGYAQFEGR